MTTESRQQEAIRIGTKAPPAEACCSAATVTTATSRSSGSWITTNVPNSAEKGADPQQMG
jgi:hypothetical protein